MLIATKGLCVRGLNRNQGHLRSQSRGHDFIINIWTMRFWMKFGAQNFRIFNLYSTLKGQKRSFSRNQKFEALVGYGAEKSKEKIFKFFKNYYLRYFLSFLVFFGEFFYRIFSKNFNKDTHVEMLKRGRARSG